MALTADYVNTAYSGIKGVIEGMINNLCESAKILQGPIDPMALEQRVAMLGSVQLVDQREMPSDILGSNGHYSLRPPIRDDCNRGELYNPMIDSRSPRSHNHYNGPRANQSRQVYAARATKKPNMNPIITYKKRKPPRHTVRQQIPRRWPSRASA